jgi:hypothetical protein
LFPVAAAACDKVPEAEVSGPERAARHRPADKRFDLMRKPEQNE